MAPDNEGIYQTGGNISADQLAVGRNARAIKTIHQATESLERRGLDEISTKLDELKTALETHADSLGSSEIVLQSLEAVARELTEPQPNKLTIQAVLDGIAGAVNRGGGVATAVTALREAVLSFL